MDAYYHYYQYQYYLNKANTHKNAYKQCMDAAAYHLRMYQILSNQGTSNDNSHEKNIQSATISTEYIKNKLIDVEYPRVSGLSNAKVERQINQNIRSLVEQMISEQISRGGSKTTIIAKYKVPLNQKGLLSIKFENYAYTPPAAHGFTIVRSLTFDLNTGVIYGFSDLFNKDSDYKAVLNKIIEKQIEEREIPLLVEFKGVSDDQEYYLTPNSLVIYYQLYELAPYVYGIIEFPISYSEIKNYINPDGPISKLI